MNGNREVEQMETSWLKVKLPPDNISEKDHIFTESSLESSKYPWVLRSIEGKGLAAFSTRHFRAGDLILTETPTIWVTGHHPFTPQQVLEINEKAAILNDFDKKAFFEMANVYPELSSAEGIFLTNSFDMTHNPQGLSCGMYCALARLNHSCIPNAQQTHCPQTGAEVLYASRDIQIGEEICDCYIDLRQNRETRQKELLENFRFLCDCPACMLVGTASINVTYNSSIGSFKVHTSEISHGSKNLENKGDHDSNNGRDTNENIDDDRHNSENENRDDNDRITAFTFEDSSIDLIIESNLNEALETLLNGLIILEKTENLVWSVRYLSSAHLSIYQLCCNLYENYDDNIDQNKGGKRRRNNCDDKKNDILITIQKHIKLAHYYNVLLQGPLTPDSKNTNKLLKKYTS